MRAILARANRDLLRQFACSRVLLAFDFDGTLAPIVADPERARMRPLTRSLLRKLARHYPCAVISGRARYDASERLRGVALEAVVGNHGIEPWQSSRRGPRAAVRRWGPEVERCLAGLPGVNVEDKAHSLAVHYRQSRQKRKVRLAVERLVASLGDIRLVPGKQVVNLLPRGAPHKGDALEKVRARLGCDTAIYVGDDETDEDVFALDQPGRLLTIRVGRRRGSLAGYFLRSQGEIDALLAALLACVPERA